MTRVYLAGQAAHGNRALKMWDHEAKPLSRLVSFAYPSDVRRVKTERFESRMLDSGAFTAHNNGTRIDIDLLINEALTGGWDEAVGLDVIGDAEGSMRNAEYMRERGCLAMPVFHIGDPWEHLLHYCNHWPKVGLSCLFGEPLAESFRFYEQCFARAWPHRFHSFGWAARTMLLRFPFHSVDVSSWVTSASYRSFFYGGKRHHLSVEAEHVHNGTRTNLDVFWNLQKELRAKWAKELAAL